MRLQLYPTVLWKIRADKGVSVCVFVGKSVRVCVNVALGCGSQRRWMGTTVYIQDPLRLRCIFVNDRLRGSVFEN